MMRIAESFFFYNLRNVISLYRYYWALTDENDHPDMSGLTESQPFGDITIVFVLDQMRPVETDYWATYVVCYVVVWHKLRPGGPVWDICTSEEYWGVIDVATLAGRVCEMWPGQLHWSQCRVIAGGDQTSCSVSSPSFPQTGNNTVNTVNTEHGHTGPHSEHQQQQPVKESCCLYWDLAREEVRQTDRQTGMFIVVRVEEEGLTGGLSPSWHQGTQHNTLGLEWNITNIIIWRTRPPNPCNAALSSFRKDIPFEWFILHHHNHNPYICYKWLNL